MADRLSENKVADLRTTIGINDKFLFINELFDGNMRIYDEALKKLNDCNTMAQADLLLLDLKIVYNWDSESPTVKKFVELVRRKILIFLMAKLYLVPTPIGNFGDITLGPWKPSKWWT